MRRFAVVTSTLLVAAFGCGGEAVVDQVAVPLDKLPPGALAAAEKAAPRFKFERARKSTYHGQDSFEIIGKDKRGKVREVEVSTSGKVLEVE